MAEHDNKSALIFGGGRGIGREVAMVFAGEYKNISLVSRTLSELEETVGEIKKDNPDCEVLSLKADISIFQNVDKAIRQHIERFRVLDVVVNTAAVHSPIGPLWENNPEDWASTININLIGAFNVCRSAVPLMLKQGNGTIILFSGGGAAYARPYFSAYGSSKTGVLRLTETLAVELRESGINVYAVAPGAVKTKMTKEVVENPELAGSVAYNEARDVTMGKGTPPDKAARLCLFLANKRPDNLSGCLVHSNEPYVEYCSFESDKIEGESGLLRRVPYKG